MRRVFEAHQVPNIEPIQANLCPSATRMRISNLLSRLFEFGTLAGHSDAQLLEAAFVHGPCPVAEAAFEALIERHGPMVLRVARSVLGNTHDAEDVFQATFLVLAERARGVRRRDSIASWLFGVATRVATRGEVRRRSAVEPLERRQGGGPGRRSGHCFLEGSLAGWRELHEEIDRLPERYRAVVVLCELQGCAAGEDERERARRLGCPSRNGSARGWHRSSAASSSSLAGRRGLGAIAALPW